MIASALEDIAQMHLDEGKALPVPNPDATAADADLIELRLRIMRGDMPVSETWLYRWTSS